jgi:adenosylcobinamide kinase / adenosylcobinamide-phosphate guanylyltransferase
MPLVVLLGGARSGKSRLAVALAAERSEQVTVLATAEALDAEMRERIAAHRAGRPNTWDTIEEPLALETALAAVPSARTLVVDCVSLWVANLLERGDVPADVLAAAGRVARIAAGRTSLTIVVSNEVGLGIVPSSPLGRTYRDLLGSVNAVWVDAADEAVLVVAGRALRLSEPNALLDLAAVEGRRAGER